VRPYRKKERFLQKKQRGCESPKEKNKGLQGPYRKKKGFV